MRIYARPSWKLAGQILFDVFVVSWSVAWWFVSRIVDAAISAIAVPVRDIAETAAKLSGDVGNAAGEAGKMPLVGENLRRPLDTASKSVGDIAAQAHTQVESIELTATLVGLAVFLIPVLLLLLVWLPTRWRYMKQTAAADRLLSAPHAVDLLALRALTSMSLPELAKLSPDLVTKWREGDPATTRALASAELKSLGMALPPER